MNNTKKIAVAVAMLCASGATLAQEINPSWYIQPSVVGMKADSAFGVDGHDVGGGLKFGKPLSPLFDVQVGATHVKSDSNGNSYKQTTLGVDGLLMFSRSNFRPFLLVGVGIENDKMSTPLRRASGTSPYVTAGLGFQLGLSDRWSMQADYRTVQGHLRNDEDFGFKRSNNKYLTVGFNYAFNSPPVAAVAPAPTPVAVVEAPPAPMPPPPPPPPARFEKVTMSATELFEFDKAVLRAPQPKLDEIAAALQADMSITDIDVTGYTDRLGSDKYNLALSERRAVAVREYLVAKGIDGSRLKAVGKGESNPVVQCNDKKRADLIACLAPNRRVEVEQITIEKRVR
ncbi:OmpA family protein [Massilia sp. S19_KUP03_FR1]|uniref:OmpA family protein n=1 Tax=Massilia sp. S19_KUP03_FR1 TaxID=3025503 RepID=UPI002FCDA3BE